jgi:hypothetical protein
MILGVKNRFTGEAWILTSAVLIITSILKQNHSEAQIIK